MRKVNLKCYDFVTSYNIMLCFHINNNLLLIPPSSISRFCTEEGAPVLELKACRDSNTPYPRSIRTDIP
uniref:Uncharacterized protein n=1 Tax=Siphoviridae sp. ct4Rk11 TaxID=2825330 RepID=A0A8S5PTY2_9CAUD|nr:MAG TPA: hypothetical protein [Siphoviridae sp. ct4Rk11]